MAADSIVSQSRANCRRCCDQCIQRSPGLFPD
jgi:hypothetical protein